MEGLQVKEGTYQVGMVAILNDSVHGWVQNLLDLFSLLVVTNFLKSFNYHTSEELLGKCKNHFIADMIHQIARRANFQDNSHEILDKFDVHFFERHLEHLVNKVYEGTDEFIGSFLHNRNGLFIEVSYNLIDSL